MTTTTTTTTTQYDPPRSMPPAAEPAPEIGGVKRELSRHLHPDGRTSLKKHFFGARQNGSTPLTIWSRIMKKETYPLLAAVGFGALLAAWFGTRHMSSSPDVHINKVKRQQTIRENQDQAKKWVQHHESMRQLPGAHIKQPEKA